MSIITDDNELDLRLPPRPLERSYTLAEIEALTREYVMKVSQPASMVDWRMSDFIAWLKRQEGRE